MGKIKAFAFGRYTEGRVVHAASSSVESQAEKQIHTECEYVIKKLKDIKLVSNERQKITLDSNGSPFQWFCLCDSQDIVYLAICTPDYPERFAYQMIQDLRKHFQQISQTYGEEQDSVIRMHGKNTAENLLIQYNSDNVDKMKAVQSRLSDTKNTLQENISLVIGNVNQLEDTKLKSEKLQMQSLQLKNQSADLESIMRWRNYKINIIFFLIAVGIILYIILGIVK